MSSKYVQMPEVIPRSVYGPLFLPFYYASLTNLWVYFEVDPEKLRDDVTKAPYLRGFEPYLFGKKAMINMNFQTYTGHGGTCLEIVTEVEMNIMAYPQARERLVPMGMTLSEFLGGEDQTKTIGNLRMNVAADNNFAVGAGIALFGEPKFLSQFRYNVPSANNPCVTNWTIRCYYLGRTDDDQKKAPPIGTPEQKLSAWREHEIFHLFVDTTHLDGFLSNPSPVVEYGVLEGRPIGSNWAMSGPVTSWHPLPHDGKHGYIRTGGSDHRMRRDIERLLGPEAKAVAVQIFASPPVASEPRAYWVDDLTAKPL